MEIHQAERARRLAEIGAVPQREYEASLSEQQQVEASIRAQESALAGLEQGAKFLQERQVGTTGVFGCA